MTGHLQLAFGMPELVYLAIVAVALLALSAVLGTLIGYVHDAELRFLNWVLDPIIERWTGLRPSEMRQGRPREERSSSDDPEC
jgi:hypothetical protein